MNDSTGLVIGPAARRSPRTRLLNQISRRWILAFAGVFGFLGIGPFLAPVFMTLGWTGLGRGLYFVYSLLCHQLPQRSFFLFGPQGSYSLLEIQAAWQATADPLLLRQFIGSPELGWKVAMSDRMVAMYLSALLFGLAWWLVRGRLRPLPWWAFVLLLVPMGIDGTTHLISDLAGIGAGFRDTNLWLADLTGHLFSPAFYAGDALGSFNSAMRIFSGILFGLAVAGFGLPLIDEVAQYTLHDLEL